MTSKLLSTPPLEGQPTARNHPIPRRIPGLRLIAGASLLAGAASTPAHAQTFSGFFSGNVVVSRLSYQDTGEAAQLQPGSPLPNSNGNTAVSDGTFPNVYNNLTPDANFGVLAPVFLDQITPAGVPVSTLAVPASLSAGSFSSKSESGLSLSQDGTQLSFTGYNAPVGALDRSNASTPGISISGSTDIAAATFRQVVQVTASGGFQTTTTNAYAGDNPRGAILGNNNLLYSVGNTGGTDPATTGAQIITPGVNATANSPGTTSAGSYNITQNGYAADKPAKDNNFRGVTIAANNTLLVAKGSGGNGINTVYQVGATGTLPTGTGNTISILPGFPTALAKNAGALHPFGLFSASPSVLYVADEGNQVAGDLTNPDTSNPNAGLQKWINSNANGTGTWSLAYTMRLGLGLGVAYTVAGDANNPATDGLRNLAGHVNPDGTVSLFAITSTVSSATEPGADPDRLVAITDGLAFTTATQAAGESFGTVETAQYGDVLRGVAFAPSTVPEPGTYALLLGGLGLGAIAARARRQASAS